MFKGSYVGTRTETSTSFILPQNTPELSQFFKKIRLAIQDKTLIGIKNIGLSGASLEEVFLRLGDEITD